MQTSNQGEIGKNGNKRFVDIIHTPGEYR
jgi:hypothetical protein